MEQLKVAWEALRYGGPMVYPLMALGVLALIIIVDRGAVYVRWLRLPGSLLELVESFDFNWADLDQQLARLGTANAYGRFFRVIESNRTQPAWWIESRAGDEAGRIEKIMSRGLWVLETIVTAAPLLGLLGTITGMMQSFNIIGSSELVAPSQVTAGVAQALIATALGLLIAVISLFAFNLFARIQSHSLDTMERLGTRLVDHIRLDQAKERPDEAA